LHVEDHYALPYRDTPGIKSPEFFGMIVNIDENLGKLVDFLKDEDLYDNTILVFMTDNGTYDGALYRDGELVNGYNAGMRGLKGSPYEGGHRVPFFIHWVEGGITGGRDIDGLASYVDFMPTLLDLCGIRTEMEFDGMSLEPHIRGRESNWPGRILVVDTQREEFLRKGKSFSVMTERWRLVNGELYDLPDDPGQESDVSGDHPDVVKHLKDAYEQWWEDVSVHGDEYQRIRVSGDVLPILLTQHDCHMTRGFPAWNQVMVRNGQGENGFWALRVDEPGEYDITLRRWPPESGLLMGDPAPRGEEIPGGEPFPGGKAITFERARLQVNDAIYEKETDNELPGVVFDIRLEEGDCNIQSWLTDVNGHTLGAYYVTIAKKNARNP
jgi:hypothetical protein